MGTSRRLVVVDTEEGYEIVDAETGEVVAVTSERWLAEQWVAQLSAGAADDDGNRER